MLKVAYLHFRDDAERSGWYICGPDGAIVADTPHFEHQASAARALSALINARISA